MWFLTNPNGLFLPAAGGRYSSEGSGTGATYAPGTDGRYWSRDATDSGSGYGLYFTSGNAFPTSFNRPAGFSVRCVQGD